MLYRLKSAVLTLILVLALASHAESLPVAPAPTLSVEALRADFAALYQRLQGAHTDLFVHRSKTDYDAKFADMSAAITQPMGVVEAQLYFQRFVAFGNVAHASIAFPVDHFDAFRDNGGQTFPIFLRIANERVFVGENYSGLEQIVEGQEILSLNGQPIRFWLRRTAQHISADTPYIAHSLLEFMFPRYLWVELGELATFELTLDVKGKRTTVSVPALTREQQRLNAQDRPKHFELDGTQRAAKLIDDSDIAYLRPGPFYNAEDPSRTWDNTAFVAFVDDAFNRFIDARAEHLIIDLRQNPGGDNSFSDPMLAWLADRAFRFCSAFIVRVSAEAKASNQARLDASADAVAGVSGLFASHYERVAEGQTFEFDIPLAQPRSDGRFEGKVYVLINRHSYSNAVNVAAIVQDYDMGIVAGEKTADMATTYGAMETFTLAHSGIDVGFPKAHIIRPSGDRRADGVTPDWPIVSPIAATMHDAVLDQLVQKIRSQPDAARAR